MRMRFHAQPPYCDVTWVVNQSECFEIWIPVSHECFFFNRCTQNGPGIRAVVVTICSNPIVDWQSSQDKLQHKLIISCHCRCLYFLLNKKYMSWIRDFFVIFSGANK